MIKLKNRKKVEINFSIRTPRCFYLAIITGIIGIFTLFLGTIIFTIVSVILLMIGAFFSLGEDDYQLFYKLPLSIWAIIFVVGVLWAFVFNYLNGIESAYFDMQFIRRIVRYLFIATGIILYVGQWTALMYNLITGRKKQLIKLYENGYEITNENTLDIREADLVRRSRGESAL
ncbi:hypothetical protein RZE82_06530 [Mollicutes bacterium LVI A0039]|nr:hypothetical protein RZE82_06530 [Mollicutes bacterium LVI A0039]